MRTASQHHATVAANDPPRLSVLETTPIMPGMSGYAAIEHTLGVATAADECGYHRVWVTEHHASEKIASSAPAVLIACIAARTRHVRVGSGGVMLTNHQPMVVAEQFGTLEALYPGRIDLGIGGSSGKPGPATVYEQALSRSARSVGNYPQLIDDLVGFVSGAFPAGHQYTGVRVSPRVDAVPIYVLGTSERGAGLAAARGLPFAVAHHLGVSAPAPLLQRYREAFRPSAGPAEPYTIVSVGALCAPTDAEAADIAFAIGLAEVRRRYPARGAAAPGAVRPADPPATRLERDLVRSVLTQSAFLSGSPATVGEGLAELAARTRADELMVVPVGQDGPGRITTVRLVAEGYRGAGWALPMSGASR